ncbi:Oidioi.mRNA.OKI2018_I69.PAR.g9257.t1.cds [Oikopleura dioica]|uniref:Adenosine kinase n=1 Tax=Oikopleura dioica TaxID=34765 RepID=A0ABN7RP81_OIKDI|nr:Oidioi.mRNA.OKI2018_I69.PAR.g9257.t1.cds [Oikopleura dioica]
MENFESSRILGIGNPTLEICACAAPGYLRRWEVLEGSNTEGSEKMIEEILAYFPVRMIPSGSTLNVLKAFQWLARNQNRTTFLGRVGDDEMSNILRDSIQRCGIQAHFRTVNQSTGKRLVLATRRQRGPYVKPTVVRCEQPLKLPSKVDLRRSKMLFVSSIEFSSRVSASGAVKLFRQAIGENKLTALQINHRRSEVAPKEELLELMLHSRFIFITSSCVRRTFGTYEEFLDQIPSSSAHCLVVTRGRNPTKVTCGRLSVELSVIAAEKVNDTQGANDAFVGAFLHQIIDEEELNEENIKEALTAGHWAKSEVLQRHGANIPRQKNYYAWRAGTADYSHRCRG